MANVAALADTPVEVEQALADLQRAGLRDEDFSLIIGDRRRSDLGGLAERVVGLGAVTIPGIGPALAAGPVTAALADGSLGDRDGGLLGALADVGLPVAAACAYQEGVARGRLLVTINTPAAREQEVRILLLQHGLHDVSPAREPWEDAPMPRSSPASSLAALPR